MMSPCVTLQILFKHGIVAGVPAIFKRYKGTIRADCGLQDRVTLPLFCQSSYVFHAVRLSYQNSARMDAVWRRNAWFLGF